MSFLTLLSFFAAISLSYQEVTVYTPELLLNLPPVDFSLSVAVQTDIKLYLFTSASQTEGVLLDAVNIKTLAVLPTKIFFHCYNADISSEWYAALKAAYFQKGPHNIILVDWSLASNLEIRTAQANTRAVGEFIANLLVQINIDLGQIHLIGHGLGCHVASFVGKHIFILTNGHKLGRITGLEPMGPGFITLSASLRLCVDDAIFVDVHHTEIRLRGFVEPCGHVDIYPNYGKDQPGCEPTNVDPIHRCSHYRCVLYFIESVNTQTRCRPAIFSLLLGLQVDLSLIATLLFGDCVDLNARGVFFLQTAVQAPFLIV